MNNYKTLIISSLVVGAIISTPTSTFASKNDENRNENKIRVEQEVRTENKNGFWDVKGKSEFSNAIFHRFEDWFNNKKEIIRNRKTERVEEREKDRKKVEQNNLAPKIESITAPTVLEINEVGTWKIKASDPKNKALTYAVDFGDTDTSNKTISSSLKNQEFVQTSTFTHSYKNEGVYKIKFTVSNEDDLKTASTVTVKIVKDKDAEDKDTTAPIISNIGINTGISNNVNISWKTNEKTTGEIFYSSSKGVDVENANTLRVSDKNLKTNHSLSIPGLASDTLYHFVLKSADASNNVVLSSEVTFVTN